MHLRERRKNRGEFFTSDDVSNFLISKVESTKPQFFLDLGAGKGSLSRAVQSRWSDIQGSTVEIDNDNLKFLKDNYPKLTHYNYDILSCDFPQRMREDIDIPIDLIVSNPPFIKIAIDKKLKGFFKDSPLEEHAFHKSSIESELLFIAHASELVDKSGEIAVIVPDFIVTSSKSKHARQALFNNLGLYKIIELRCKSFAATDVKTHMLFFRKNLNPDRKIQVSKMGQEGFFLIDKSDFFTRGDYKYYSLSRDKKLDVNTVKLREICNIMRGNMPMHIAKEYGYRPFHTTDFSDLDIISRIGIGNEEFSRMGEFRIANSGDLLMGRVGRNIAHQRLYVPHGGFNISDCIISISASDRSQSMMRLVDEQLSSKLGVNWLESVFRGSGAKSISLKDLGEFPIFIGGINE